MRSRTLGGRACFALAIVVFAVLAGFSERQRAEATTLPTLATEYFVSEVAGAASVPGDSFAMAGVCDPDAASTFSFSAEGRAGGNYRGRFSESGTFTIGPNTGIGNRRVVEYESAFTIRADGGFTITGTKRLLETRYGACGRNGDGARFVNFDAVVAYEAAITGPDGTYPVEGTARVNGNDTAPSVTTPDGWITFSSVFVTASPIDIPPASVTLTPSEATNYVRNEHCVIAIVRDPSGDLYPGASVRFTVSGVNTAHGAQDSDGNAQARFCYMSGSTPGTDTIRAFADVDRDGLHDANEPATTATATFVPVRREPASLTLDPTSATVSAGAEHCVTASVSDTAGEPIGDATVRFAVTGVSSASGSVATSSLGEARFCYAGPTSAGSDAIRAHADTDGDGAVGAGEPTATALVEFVSTRREPASVSLDPAAASVSVDTNHCVTATVRDSASEPVPDASVRFTVTGASTAADSVMTDAEGLTSFCYGGPAFPGSDGIRVFADSDRDGDEDAGEPVATAAVTYVLPASTAGCSTTFGGAIRTTGGGKATFGGNAFAASASTARGEETYDDRLLSLRITVTDVVAVVCSTPSRATIYGRASVNGAAPSPYRIRVVDAADPGAGIDTYGLLLAGGYSSGQRPLDGGNVQVRTR